MEIQLQELIDQIKKDGVATAEAEAKTIVETARSDAEKIIFGAQAQADKILTDAKTEAERMTKSSEDAIRQAGRNLLIS
ncbi:MAG: V-type ATP synthase subunit E, partial [Clostridia bacterium]|nr:V-type ATP synthase subunit E [Clostridia bacterium]